MSENRIMGGKMKLLLKQQDNFIFAKFALRTCIYTVALVCGA